MSASQYLLNLGLLVLVLATGLGTRRLSARRIILPMAIAAGFGVAYLKGMPSAGNDTTLELTGAAVGVVFGVVAALLVKVGRDGAGRLTTHAGIGYALVWGAALVGRCVFAYGADHWFSQGLVTFSIAHRITSADAWTCAFVLMALAMVVTRVAVTLVRAAAARRTVPAASATTTAAAGARSSIAA